MYPDSERYDEKNRPIGVSFENGMMSVKLGDGRIISTPLDWYPRLANATPEQLQAVELMFDGIHWPKLDEDLSVYGMLQGHKSLTPAKEKKPQISGQ